jgi:superfamily II DNA or RNA helicase
VNADTNRKRLGRILESFEQGQEVKILIGTSLLGEGVDLPTTDALVYAKGEKAEVTLTQNMFRVATAVSGKKNAILVDFSDRHNKHLLRHSEERLRVYYEESIFSVTVLQDTKSFEKWLEGVNNL